MADENLENIEYPEVEVTMPDGNKLVAFEIPIDESNERFNEYTLRDGTKLQAKLVVQSARRIKEQWDSDGNPIYYIQSNNIIRVFQAHPSVKKPKDR